MTETKPYKLYAVKTNAIPDGALKDIEFSLIPTCSNGRYCLIFTDKQLPEKFREIGAEVPLSDEERKFVAQCKATVNSRYMRENETEYAELLSEFCEKLSEELEVEKKKMGEKK